MMSKELADSGVQRIWAEVAVAGTVFCTVAAACFIGIWSRPAGLLASVWLANAVLLGLLLRWPAAGRPLPLIGAALAYLCADLLIGASLGDALALNATNLVSVAAAYSVYWVLPVSRRRLRDPGALAWLMVAALFGGCCAGLTWALMSLGDLSLHGAGVLMWVVTEAVNYLAVLPVMLAAPGREAWARRLPQKLTWRRRDLLPAASVALSCLLAVMIGGPGAVAMPVLALLWCGSVYPVFPTTVLTLVFGTFALGSISSPLFVEEYGLDNHAALLSLRIGISAVALMPVLLALLNRRRNELTLRLRFLATHDGLTGIRNRNAFLDQAGAAFASATQPLAVLLLDLDRFKDVNDSYGHAAGDRVLIESAARLGKLLRAEDLFARLGGEEFAVLLTNCYPGEATLIAERLRAAVCEYPMRLEDGQEISVTVSIGLATVNPPCREPLHSVMARADRCLYRAKEQGRNRVCLAPALVSILPEQRQALTG